MATKTSPAKRIAVKFVLKKEALGMTPADPNMLQKFYELRMAKLEAKQKSLDPSVTEKEKRQARLTVEKLKTEGIDLKGTCVFPIDADGNPLWHNFQMAGMIKDHLNMEKDSKRLGEWKKNARCWVDKFVHISPVDIPIQLPEGITPKDWLENEENWKGRIVFSGDEFHGKQSNPKSSQTIPAGSSWKCWITLEDFDNNFKLLYAALQRCQVHGFGEWRNGTGNGIADVYIFNDEKKVWQKIEEREEYKCEELPEG